MVTLPANRGNIDSRVSGCVAYPYGKPVLNIYIRKVERKNGQLVNTTIETVREVTQFWTYDPKQFVSGPQYGRDVPPAKNLE